MPKDRRRAACVAFLAATLAAPAARAWNDHGHMLVAAIAYRHLTPHARDRVQALLALNPDHAAWIAGVPAASREAVAFLRAATWADAIKRANGYVNDSDHPTGAAARQNVGYADKLQHRYWHFIDLPIAADGTKPEQPTTPNAETQIAVFRATLASPTAPDALKSYDLVWLLHLVGDVHQPLHCASRFDQSQPHGDHGGNKVLLCAPPCTDELHGFWDGVTGDSVDPAETRAQAADLAAADPALAAVDDAAKWIAESFEAAKAAVYVAPIGAGAGPFPLDAHYRTQAHRLALRRVAVAGARLAALLNHAVD
jgi:hypothetical protein